MTKQEESAIKSLRAAFKKCDKLGLRFCGMDNDLYFCTQAVFQMASEERDDHRSDYNEVAFAIQQKRYGDEDKYEDADMLISGSPYVDSGGW